MNRWLILTFVTAILGCSTPGDPMAGWQPSCLSRVHMPSLDTYEYRQADQAAGLPEMSPEILELLQEGVEVELDVRNYTPVSEGEDADFWVSAYVVVNQKQELVPVRSGASGGVGASPLMLQNRMTYRRTTVVEVHLPDWECALWRGKIESLAASLSATSAGLAEDVRAVLDDFPTR